jgi:hypothetical protein
VGSDEERIAELQHNRPIEDAMRKRKLPISIDHSAAQSINSARSYIYFYGQVVYDDTFNAEPGIEFSGRTVGQ